MIMHFIVSVQADSDKDEDGYRAEGDVALIIPEMQSVTSQTNPRKSLPVLRRVTP